MNINIYLMVGLCLFGLLYTSCDDDGDCEALSDITGEVNADSTSTLAGSGFDFDHNLENVSDDICDLTETAGSSDTRLTVEYTSDPTMPFLVEFDDFFGVDAIPAGEMISEQYSVIFEEPGIYLLRTYADGKFVVEERNEFNNQNEIGAEGRSLEEKDAVNGMLITVMPSPDYQPSTKSGRVQVKRVGVRKSF
jgi:hypothetical protein